MVLGVYYPSQDRNQVKDTMTAPLMPKATAVWLIDNTSLSFEQIADFCSMHPFEIQSIADADIGGYIVGQDPILSGQLTAEEIARCEQSSTARLQLSEKAKKHTDTKKKKASRYTPVARRQDKPDAISWLLKHCPNVTDLQIVRLIGTTKSTIASLRTRSHWNAANIRPRDPVLLGLCTQTELNALLALHQVDKPNNDSGYSII
jgi:hypothetical protein